MSTTIPTSSNVLAAIDDLVAEAAKNGSTASLPISGTTAVVIAAFPERTGPKGGVKPIGIGAGLKIDGKKPIYFYNEKTAQALLKLMGTPAKNAVGTALIKAARAVESWTAQNKPKKSKAVAPEKKALDLDTE